MHFSITVHGVGLLSDCGDCVARGHDSLSPTLDGNGSVGRALGKVRLSPPQFDSAPRVEWTSHDAKQSGTVPHDQTHLERRAGRQQQHVMAEIHNVAKITFFLVARQILTPLAVIWYIFSKCFFAVSSIYSHVCVVC